MRAPKSIQCARIVPKACSGTILKSEKGSMHNHISNTEVLHALMRASLNFHFVAYVCFCKLL